MSEPHLFASLRADTRIWAVGAIHADVERLQHVHALLAARLCVGDQVVYLGNYTGRQPAAIACLNELLQFRRAVIAVPGAEVSDVTFLRGAQEEMWSKLLELHFALNPASVMEWILGQGVAATIEAYQMKPSEGLSAARHGPQRLAMWLNALRGQIRRHDGHQALMSSLRHAAVCANHQIAFVHAGIDANRPLMAQGDLLWWGGGPFGELSSPISGVKRVVRGYDRRRGGFFQTNAVVTLDGGCGTGGALLAGCFSPNGQLIDLLEG